MDYRLMDIAYCLPQIHAITVHGPSTRSQPKTSTTYLQMLTVTAKLSQYKQKRTNAPN